jgi:hypothetical protein
MVRRGTPTVTRSPTTSGHQARAGPVAPSPAADGAGPRQLDRQDPRLPGLADGQVTAAALLRRHDVHRGHAGRDPQGARAGVDARLRRGQAGQVRRVGRGHHQAPRPVVLAGGNAGHRPQGAPAPRSTAAVHRHRRPPVHRPGHRRQERPAHRPGTKAPSAGPLHRAPTSGVKSGQVEGGSALGDLSSVYAFTGRWRCSWRWVLRSSASQVNM